MGGRRKSGWQTEAVGAQRCPFAKFLICKMFNRENYVWPQDDSRQRESGAGWRGRGIREESSTWDEMRRAWGAAQAQAQAALWCINKLKTNKGSRLRMTMTTMTMLVLLQLHCPLPPPHKRHIQQVGICVCALDWVEKPGKEIAAKGEEQDTRETIAKIVQLATMRCVCAAVCVCMCVCVRLF